MKKTISELYRERFPEATAVQKKAIPLILSGKNTLVVAPTGSGKTEAAVLPVLEKIHGEAGIAALYITPLRALNRDICKRVEWWAEHAGISHAVRHGDTPQSERAKQSRKPPQLLIITPETLQAILVGKVLRKHLANVKYVIVDELHELVDNKRGAQLSMALERLGVVADFQRIGVSATISDEQEAGKLLCGVGRKFEVAAGGKRRKMDISVVKSYGGEEKAFEKLIGMIGDKQRILFVNTRSTAEAMATYLNLKTKEIDVHHGSLAAGLRINTEKEFKKGKVHTLIATSSLELGLDIGGIDEVIQFGSPRQVARMVQRVGRSGHGVGRLPVGKIIAGDIDDYLEAKAIVDKWGEGYLEKREAVRGAMDVVGHQVVGMLMDNGKMKQEKIFRVLSRAYSFGLDKEGFEKVVEQLWREKLVLIEYGNLILRRYGREYYFYNLTTIPKERKFKLRDRITNRIIASLDEVFVVNLAPGETFSSKGKVWTVVEIEADELIAEPAMGFDFVIPDWVGEEIPVEWEVAREVAKLREKEVKLAPKKNEIYLEIVDDVAVVHSCFGNRVNDLFARIFAKKLGERLKFEVIAVADPYRVMLKFPYPVAEEWIEGIFEMGDVGVEAERALEGSSLLRMSFLHVGRLFGLFGENAEVSSKMVRFMRESPVYEEAVEAVFRRRLDIEGAEKVVEGIRKGKYRLRVEKRKRLSMLGRVGVGRLSRGDAMGAFEPRESMIRLFREELENKKVTLKCLNCGAIRITTAGKVEEGPKCHKCRRQALAPMMKHATKEEEKYMTGILRAYGKRGLYALLVYGVGAKTADRVLRRLHRDEESFFLDLIEEQKKFIKNKKYWSVR
ncbi:DEAD/DEAH box helicase [Candidatus Micrarchaeota archaeon]|nr:DEAD/DEAH box helicase [Candidatus Micrarchaeota archaeon]MBD3417714.1 DEAD/DEAH box helicase [Candidatus Micrarchaeota archaeon]